MSQSVFAAVLNIATGYPSRQERGEKRPTGPALAMLNVIRRKGIEAVLWMQRELWGRDMANSSEAETLRRRKEAASRALAEAEARRQAGETPPLPKEVGNRKGPEPTRYGDWEKKGIVSDF